jgi:hypothetical protein
VSIRNAHQQRVVGHRLDPEGPALPDHVEIEPLDRWPKIASPDRARCVFPVAALFVFPGAGAVHTARAALGDRHAGLTARPPTSELPRRTRPSD